MIYSNYNNEKIYTTNIIINHNPVLLRVWKKSNIDKTICSRLDSYNNFSIPFLGAKKHKELIKKIKIIPVAPNIKLLNW